MKKLAVAFAAAFVLCTGAAQAETLEYTFATQADAADFKQVPAGRSWTVAGGAYAPDKAGSGFVASVVDTTFTNVTARTSVATLTPKSLAGLVLRASSVGPRLSGYIGAIQNTGKVTVARIYRFTRYDLKQASGSFLDLCTKDIKLIDEKNIEFVANGTALSLYYNGKLVCSAKDSQHKGGKVGLFGTASKQPKISFSSASFAD
ncbi:hypothetical protein [Methylopila sp. M107]|uniref:hypothetical protein n=1 Tax=Methylopila sp. M107 TaxID=1101190 RepID=UPI00037FECB3|nr:hypothetical protein [Methylopila sp. M107]